MPDLVARSVNGVPIRLTDEGWQHIQKGHSENRRSKRSLARYRDAGVDRRRRRRRPDLRKQKGRILAGSSLSRGIFVVRVRNHRASSKKTVEEDFERLILREPDDVEWSYDDGADVLYVSFGKPRPALGWDVGGGVIMRYTEDSGELVGFTLVGIGVRLGATQSNSAATATRIAEDVRPQPLDVRRHPHQLPDTERRCRRQRPQRHLPQSAERCAPPCE